MRPGITRRVPTSGPAARKSAREQMLITSHQGRQLINLSVPVRNEDPLKLQQVREVVRVIMSR